MGSFPRVEELSAGVVKVCCAAVSEVTLNHDKYSLIWTLLTNTPSCALKYGRDEMGIALQV